MEEEEQGARRKTETQREGGREWEQNRAVREPPEPRPMCECLPEGPAWGLGGENRNRERENEREGRGRSERNPSRANQPPAAPN